MTSDNGPQKVWDACLIRCWRKDLKLYDVFKMYRSIMNGPPEGLLRMPSGGMPWQIRVRAFVASYLPKINDRLWDQDPEKDVLLLRKLQTSSYNTLKIRIRENAESELEREQKRHIKSKQKITLSFTNALNRNHDTDWNVTKGSSRVRRMR